MSLRVLVIPDKFKGTFSASGVAEAIARGWKKVRPKDSLKILPMSDGGDGFGEVLSNILTGKPQTITTVNAAHQKITATWWWEPKSKTAIIESAKVIGLAMLPPKKFHPYQLDTFGLGKVIEAATGKGAKRCLIGIGGSATNDGGFGLARSVGWRFTDRDGVEITKWSDDRALFEIHPPHRTTRLPKIIVAVDVINPLCGTYGCSFVYGPQKGLSQIDAPIADQKLKRMATVAKRKLQLNFAKVPGAGAAGGLGYGLMTYLNAKPESGFDLFARHAHLEKEIHNADLVITGEGALDRQTFMGKGVGQIALLCKKLKVPCLGIAGVVLDPEKGKGLFQQKRGIVELTSLENAKKRPAVFLEKLASDMASDWKVGK